MTTGWSKVTAMTLLAEARVHGLAQRLSLDLGWPRRLDTVPAPAHTHRVRLTDHDTVVVQRGDTGPAVLLVHALGMDWRMWEPVMDALAHGRRVFAYDVRGHGAAVGAPSPYTMADTARDLICVLEDGRIIERGARISMDEVVAITRRSAEKRVPIRAPVRGRRNVQRHSGHSRENDALGMSRLEREQQCRRRSEAA